VDGDLFDEVGEELPAQPFQGPGWGLEYDSFHSYEENERLRYEASGSVKTEDGRTIDFRLELSLSRSYYEQSSISIRMGSRPRTDPLVIAYAAAAPALSGRKVAFDLDADGRADNVSFATAGSGFLALDKNGDGVINDGSELFGPQSGNGFMDLRAYDLDGNGWIDGNDPVFGKLSILTLEADGNTALFSLGQAGVGAICLNETKTEYSFKNGREADGVMRASSVFLRENGTAGTIHHIDLTI
ncbi:MAG TPA: VCBS repeat-containing protein, partial [Feifaniaceae bacterium]|nr:VCBS repeat-containing protein [Feifaniaceae bacterium]